MSMQSAAAFFDKALVDQDLQKKIVAAAGAVAEPTEKAEAVAKLGRSMGFDFSPAEAIELRAATRKALIDNGKMNDELDELDLQTVAGGISATTIASQGAGLAAGFLAPALPIAGGAIGVVGAGLAVGASFFGAGVAGGVENVMNGGDAAGFFTGFADGVVGHGNTIANAFTDPIGTIESIFSGW